MSDDNPIKSDVSPSEAAGGTFPATTDNNLQKERTENIIYHHVSSNDREEEKMEVLKIGYNNSL